MRRGAWGVALFSLLAACSFLPDAPVTVELPALPACWKPLAAEAGCLLRYWDPAGAEQAVRLEAWQSGAPVAVCRGANSPVLAYPVLATEGGGASPGALRPAGGLYPLALQADGGQTRFVLRWEDGPAATVMVELLRSGMDTSLFNGARLTQELRRKEDPWAVDLAGVETAIAAGVFNAYAIDPLPARDASVRLGPGRWCTESPFRAAVPAAADGSVALSGISLGMHTLFSGTGSHVSVEVAETGVTVFPLGSLTPPPLPHVRQ